MAEKRKKAAVNSSSSRIAGGGAKANGTKPGNSSTAKKTATTKSPVEKSPARKTAAKRPSAKNPTPQSANKPAVNKPAADRTVPTGWPRGMPLPKGWTAPLLSEVAHRESGHTPEKDIPEYWNGGIKWLSLADCDRLNRVYVSETSKAISEAGIDHSSARLLPPGLVVLSRDAGVGQSAITTCPMAVSQHFLAWKCSDRLDPLFLYYWFQFLRPELERIAVGSTIKTIGLWYFDRLRVPVPPIATQHAVVAGLNGLDRLAEGIAQMAEAKGIFKRGLMQKVLTGRKRFREFLDRPWIKVAIGDVFEEAARPVKWDEDATYTLVSVRRRSGGLFLRERKKGADIKVKALYEIHEGDILISTRQVVHGAIARVPPEFHGAHVSGEYMVLVPKSGAAILPEYFDHLSRLPRMYHISYLASYGVDIEKLMFNPAWYLESLIDLPPTIKEQQRIAAVLDAQDRELLLLAAQREKLEIMRRALLSKFLSGDLQLAA